MYCKRKGGSKCSSEINHYCFPGLNNHFNKARKIKEKVYSILITRRYFLKIGLTGVILSSISELPYCTARKTQRKVVVFVLDTGVNSRFVGGEVRGDLDSEIGHGSIVAKAIRDQCSKCEIISINIQNIFGDIVKSKVFNGLSKVLNYALENQEIDIIVNISSGSYIYDPREHDIIKELYKKGVIIVASAGNDNTFQSHYPAAYDEVIAVAALTEGTKKKTDYSNWGSYVDLAASGSTHQIEQYLMSVTRIIAAGTSFAAPLISGLIGRLLYKYPDISSSEAVAIIKYSAKPIDDPYYKRGELGLGLVEPRDVFSKIKKQEDVKRDRKIAYSLFSGYLIYTFLKTTYTIWKHRLDKSENDLIKGQEFNIELSNKLITSLSIIFGGIVGIFIGSGLLISPPLLPKVDSMVKGLFVYAVIAYVIRLIYRLLHGRSPTFFGSYLKNIIENYYRKKTERTIDKINSINDNFTSHQIKYLVAKLIKTYKPRIYTVAFDKLLQITNPSIESLANILNNLDSNSFESIIAITLGSHNQHIPRSYFKDIKSGSKKIQYLHNLIDIKLTDFLRNEKIDFKIRYNLARNIIVKIFEKQIGNKILDLLIKLLISNEQISTKFLNTKNVDYLASEILPALEIVCTNIKLQQLKTSIKKYIEIIEEREYMQIN
ncbi:MAG: S8 family serine peptidase [Candidatus Aminicenantaceae bacterium]